MSTRKYDFDVVHDLPIASFGGLIVFEVEGGLFENANLAILGADDVFLEDNDLDAFNALKVAIVLVDLFANSGSRKRPKGSQEQGGEELHDRQVSLRARSKRDNVKAVLAQLCFAACQMLDLPMAPVMRL